MTICCKLNSVINLESYREKFVDNIESKVFYNCVNTYITVKYQGKKRISAKIFKNGNIQFAGVLNVMSATYAVRKIYRRLIDVNAFLTPETSRITDVRICMINSDFKITKNIKQKLLCSCLDEIEADIIKRYTYNPSKYPGINLKIEDPETKNKLTVAIFRPGSIILTGGSDIKLYYRTFKYLINILNNNELLY
jgi:TATA-box binding protein (TBP) (component of TFIID and TFIIIB)